MNDAIQRELLPNPLGFEGDALELSSNQKSEVPAEKNFWENAANYIQKIGRVLGVIGSAVGGVPPVEIKKSEPYSML